MSLLDDVIVSAASVVGAAGKVATDVVERSKVRVSSAELKSKISSQFEALGRYIYDTSLSGQCDQSKIDAYVGNITMLINEHKSLQNSLSANSGKMMCPKCCTKNSSDSLFCKKCGTSLDFANSYTSAEE